MADHKRILLLGGTGRVGRMVLRHRRTAPPARIDIVEQHRDPDRSTGHYWPLLEDPDDRLAALQFDAIICLSGVTPGPGAELSQNTRLADVVLETAHKAAVQRVKLASSSAVYGSGNGMPFTETDATARVNAYGEAKIAVEEVCAPWRNIGLEVCCMRIGNVAGVDALLLNVALARNDEPLAIDCFANGRGPVRSYIGAQIPKDV